MLPAAASSHGSRLLLLAWAFLTLELFFSRCSGPRPSFLFARWTFRKSLLGEDAFQTVSGRPGPEQTAKPRLAVLLASPFRDPLGALIEKEIASLVRMPRFRVVYATSCLLGLIIFIPAALRSEHAGGFFERNLLPMVNAYGLLILGETLLLNVFGLDRTAAQIYFAAPLELRVVMVAKNLVAIWFVLIQNVIIALVAASLRASFTRVDLAAGLMVCVVLTVFLLTAGNIISVIAARPVDPRETFKKQSSAKIQLWTLGATLVLFLLVGFAFLARYAFHSTGALFWRSRRRACLRIHCLPVRTGKRCAAWDARQRIVASGSGEEWITATLQLSCVT